MLDQAAFALLYETEATAVFNYARYRVGPDEEADAASDAFARAWSRRSTYDPSRGVPKAWLWAIVRTTVADVAVRRARPSQSRFVPNLNLDRVQTAAPDPESDLLWEVIEASRALKPVDREILALRFGAGLAHRSIAEYLGLSEANVAQRLRRALDRLREVLSEEPT